MVGHYLEEWSMTMSSGQSRPPRALIVEDEILIALALDAEMKDLGFDVCGLAANARQAIAMAMEDEPDLAVMDIYLNGARDGIETARVLRDLCGVQVVFVTAYSDDEGLTERIQQQVPNAPVLTKPLYGNRLADAIGKASEGSTLPAM
jgi:DNA-binding NarL/FixJ family response regulator